MQRHVVRTGARRLVSNERPAVITVPHLLVVALLAALIWLISSILADEASTARGSRTTVAIDQLHAVPRAIVSVLMYVIGPLRLWRP